MKVKIEVGVDPGNGETEWPAEFRTWANPNDVYKALSYLIRFAERVTRTITGFRLTNEQEGLE